ncbi:methyltransferase domain-containing protein [Methylobacterium sp. C25]|uniref:methyltransferase regulatory domain-containing protein n=1 Tax=Methylobacterium sp. C25 TaxID=2721622 RepID=UPI001F339FCD|nr:class I SAM-dependent methyltransferase [Methylobacterium sp. C25]MCE4226448.1 methyltransferase domain-containing protein [Methylobacterium sp. C25]
MITVQKDARAETSSYDEVPYTSRAFPATDPRRLSAIARLFGLNPPSPAEARVLEIGCAGGGNLLPLAARLPEAHFVGIDASGTQIAHALAQAETLGIENVRFEHRLVQDLDETFGSFDYVICHGVYSWVPSEVQDAIFDACRKRLTPDGVAFISYNTYPGWKTREIVRDAMMFHTGGVEDLRAKLGHGRGMLDFMREMAAPGTLFTEILQGEAPGIATGEDAYLIHEFLEAHNTPCYFHDFAGRARGAGLAYLADSTLATMFADNLEPSARERLMIACGGDQVVLEQYLDFCRNRQFRQSLLVHADKTPQIDRRLTDERLKGLQYRSLFHSRSPDADGRGFVYEGRAGWARAESAVERAALDVIFNAQGRALDYGTWEAGVANGLGETAMDRIAFAGLVGLLVTRGLLDVLGEGCETELGASPPERLHADELALRMVAAGQLEVTNAYHELTRLSPVDAVVLPRLDEEDKLGEAVFEAVEAGQIQLLMNGTPITDTELLRSESRRHAESSIARLRALGFVQGGRTTIPGSDAVATGA